MNRVLPVDSKDQDIQISNKFYKSDKWPLYIFLTVPVVLLLIVFVFPLFYSFYLSLTNTHLLRQSFDFVGFENYFRILQDDRVWHSIRVTFTFALGSFALQFVFGFALALLIDYVGFVKEILRTLIVIPLMLTPVVLGVVWRTMLNYDYGIFNYLLSQVGVAPINWVHDPAWALPALIILDAWHGVPFVMLVLAAGLASLPSEPFESAQIDGATPWQTLRYLTIPMLRPIIMVVVIFSSYQLLRAFDTVFTLTSGGPARATETLSYHIYSRLFLGSQVGNSATIAYILLGITLLVVIILYKLFERRDDDTHVASKQRQPKFLRTMSHSLEGMFKFIGVALDQLVNGIVFVISVPFMLVNRLFTQFLKALFGRDIGYQGRRRVGVFFGSIVIIVWVIISLFPVAWIYLSSLKEPADVFAIPPKWTFTPTTHNYEVVLGLKYGTESELSMLGVNPPLSQFPNRIANSFIISISATLLNLVFGTLAAYALVRLRTRAKNLILMGMLFTRMVPPVMLILPIFLMWRQLGLLGTYQGIVFGYLAFGLPFSIWMMRGYLIDIPVELEEAARVDGCSRLGAFFRIILPMTAPGVAATAVFLFIGSWNEFLFAIILGNNAIKTVTVEILGYVTDQSILFGRLFAASGLILLPVIVFTVFVQRYIASGLTGGALKG